MKYLKIYENLRFKIDDYLVLENTKSNDDKLEKYMIVIIRKKIFKSILVAPVLNIREYEFQIYEYDISENEYEDEFGRLWKISFVTDNIEKAKEYYEMCSLSNKYNL